MEPSHHWLDAYASRLHDWQFDSHHQAYTRNLGYVESSFQADNFYYGGRADINLLLTLEVRNQLTQDQLREKILLAWATLRVCHPLLMAAFDGGQPPDTSVKRFVVGQPSGSVSEVQERAASTVTFLDVPPEEAVLFYRHLINTGRVTEPEVSMSKLFVFPLEPLTGGTYHLKLGMVVCHMASDGLTMTQWTRHLIELFNTPTNILRSRILPEALRPSVLRSCLPPTQESLYPKIPGNRARQRWFWLLVRILRHVRKPPPPGFPNPLRREKPLEHSVSMPQTYPAILNYTPEERPPLNTYIVSAAISPAAAERLIRNCRAVGASVGAGCFALLGLVMMELHEAWNPEVNEPRAPFVASFPLNARSFLKSAPTDSCMLAFSDGIVMPFLSSDLDIEGRLRLVSKIAHRQLTAYRVRKESEDPLPWLDPHSPLRMVAVNYLITQDRSITKVPMKLAQRTDPQGPYKAGFDFSTATCGVSSIGSIEAAMARGKYKVDGSDSNEEGFAADFRSWTMGVRARDNEFLVACMGDSAGMHFIVAYDGNAIDEDKVACWKDRLESILEPDQTAKL
jgi:hypothetical protein